jgi:hypothetical protein
MKRISVLSLIAGLSAGLGFAGEPPAHPGRTSELRTLECYLGCSKPVAGHVLVKSCANRYASLFGHLNAEAAQHARECSVTWAEPASDLGLLVDGTFFRFDEAGTAIAKEALAKATDPTNTVFRVFGHITNRGGGWISGMWGGIPIPPAHKIKVERIEELR